MQDIYIDNVKLKNVANYTGEMEFDFPPGFTLIVGKNGAGKSTIFKSIALAFYGDSGGVDKLPISDFVNRKTKRDLEIIVNFRIVENNNTDNYTIKLYQEHKQFKNKMFLLKNGIDISGKSKTETYEMIEKIILPRSIFHNTVYFSQQVKDFFTSLTNTEQKQIFDSILSTQDYKIFYGNSDLALKQLMSFVLAITNELSNHETTVGIKKQSLDMFQSSKNKALKDNELTIFDLSDKRIKKENEIQILQDKKEELSFDQNSLDLLKVELRTIESKLRDLKQSIDKEKLSLDSTLAAEIKNESLKIEVEKTNKITDLTTTANNAISGLNSDLAILLSKLTEVERKYDTSSLLKDHNDFRFEKQKEIIEVDKLISLLDDEFSTTSIESESKARINVIEKNIQDIRDKANKIKELAVSIKTKITEKENAIKEDEQKLNQEVSICSKCLRPFGSAEDSKAIRDFIEQNKNDSSTLNSELSTFKSQLDVLKNDYEETVKLKNKTESDYQDKIQDRKNKKKERSDGLIRKRNLIQEEISAHKSEIDVKIQELLKKKEHESSELKVNKVSIELDISKIKDQLKTDKGNVEYSFSIDLDKCKIEHIKKYDVLRDEINSKFKLQEINFTSEVIRLTSEIEKFEKIKKEIEKLTTSIQLLSAEINSYNNQLAKCKEFSFDDSQITQLTNEIAENEKKIVELNIKKTNYQREQLILEFWKEAFSDTGIKSMLIDMAIPHMNESVSKALEIVAPGVFTVSFDTLKMTKSGDIRDKFNVNVLHNIKGTDSHKMLSGGEKRLVDLCCMEALRSLSEKLYGKRIHNIFYDEVLDSLDDDSCQIFGQASKALANGKNITLIAHRATENIEPDRTFNF
jgi:DNA repair exonuclease SbcCD ATPase subunit